jgi:hypothetical protein
MNQNVTIVADPFNVVDAEDLVVDLAVEAHVDREVHTGLHVEAARLVQKADHTAENQKKKFTNIKM